MADKPRKQSKPARASQPSSGPKPARWGKPPTGAVPAEPAPGASASKDAAAPDSSAGPPPPPRPTRPARERSWPATRPWAGEGTRLVQASYAGTVLFVLTATAAAAAEAFRGEATVVALVLFAIGTLAFLVAYGKAIGRSRDVTLGVGGIYFLAGCAPRAVQWRLLGALGVQTVVALATASARPFTSLAFGMLVPMYGLGIAGLWGAFYGAYPARPDSSASLPADE